MPIMAKGGELPDHKRAVVIACVEPFIVDSADDQRKINSFCVTTQMKGRLR